MKSSKSEVRRKPGRPKAGEPSSVRSDLLRTASALFLEFGYDSVSMEKICVASGVTKASVYYYFPNKAELFTASLVQIMENAGRMTGELLNRPGSFRHRLEEVAEARMRKAHVDFESLMREAGQALAPEQVTAIRAAERSIHEVLAQSFQREIELGTMRSGDPLLFAFAFSSLLMLGSRNAAAGPDFSWIAPSTIVDLFWNGVSRDVG